MTLRHPAAPRGSLEKVQTGSLDFDQYLVLLGFRYGDVVAPKIKSQISAPYTCYAEIKVVCTRS
jgi:hypothetical protein